MRERTYLVTVVVLAAAVFAGLSWLLRSAQRSALEEVRAAAAGEPKAGAEVRPVSEVARLLRNLKLVTVEVQTRVQSSRLDESWRGDVRASVDAPVRMLYGCDLSGVAEHGEPRGAGLRPNVLTEGFTLRVPRPERMAVEIDGTKQRSDVEVGWGRFRDVAGEYQLGLARTGLYEQARRMALTPEQQRQVEETTREQLTALVRAFAAGGEAVSVEVEFFDAGDGRSEYVTAPSEPGRGGGRE